jgi:outer membrane protein assembly factor BamB
MSPGRNSCVCCVRGGVLVARREGVWKSEVREAVPGFDRWNQYHYDATGSNASQDRVVGPGRSLRWIAGPQNGTNEGMLICDEFAFTIERVSDQVSRLIMRNAFNGLPMWERSDLHNGTRYATILTRERLYLLPGRRPGYGALTLPRAMLVLDPRTGATVQTLDQGITFPSREELEQLERQNKEQYKQVEDGAKSRLQNAMAVLSADGRVLLQVAGDDAIALDAASGKRLWTVKSAAGSIFMWPAIGGDVVYLCEGPGTQSFNYTFWPMIDLRQVRAVGLADGKVRWTWKWPAGRGAGALTNVVVAKGRLIMNLRTPIQEGPGQDCRQGLLLLDAASGAEAYWDVGTALLKAKLGGHSGTRMLVVGDRLWNTTLGEVLGSAPISDPARVVFPGFNQRRPAGCTSYRSTPNWIIGNLTAYPLNATSGDTPVLHTNAARNACDVGSFPANGMLYITPNHCFCLPYLPGSMAFSADAFAGVEDRNRLRTGGASAAAVPPAAGDAWPMLLRSPDRRNWTNDRLPATLEPLWTAKPAGDAPALPLANAWSHHFFAHGMATGVSVAEGIAVTAAAHRAIVVAFDPATGKERWRAAVDGRIDTQPTINRGLVLAGTANGYVYALNRDTGALAWRFRAAPREARILVNGAMESPWPVHGSIAVDGARIYVVAGRHTEADGGLWWWTLDADSGAVRAKGRIGQDELLPATTAERTKRTESLPWPGANNVPVLTPGQLLLNGLSFERKGDGLASWSMPQDMKGEWGMWKSRFEFGHLVPGNQGMVNRYPELKGYMLSQYGSTSGRIFAINGDDFINLGATITTAHRGGDGGDQIVRLKRQKAFEQLLRDGKPINAYRGSVPVWEGPKNPNTGSTAMAVAGDAILVAHANPLALDVLNLEDGKQRQRIALPAAVIGGGISSDDGRVFITLVDGTVMALGKR